MTKTTSAKIDVVLLWIIGVILVYSAIIFTSAFFSGADMGAWVWDRHQNLFSWYSRPLFIIPAAYYAYRRKIWHVLGFMLLLATSLFWFAAPASTDPAIREYLQWEADLFFSNKSKLPLLGLIVAVLIFLFSLFYAFWQRNPWLGLLVINAGTVLKIIVSLALGEGTGAAAVLP
ncbi:hypothetical protein [Sphingorhabdus sp. 109]|jgi:hypothetical protein|uniref:hypothetical protein n=1 Tax=Sphingorhabdus sp. 109 TaxID=2653173 RepID=UPI0012F1554B|nr:hypothetical protein [Sphingorhabdus sp. 109]VWX59710.1 conserved membrane hypothetical protein [Sphingorhabdus sp. 109]